MWRRLEPGFLIQAAIILYHQRVLFLLIGESSWRANSSFTKTTSGKFRFRLKARNGQIIAVGEAYETRASALNGIESVKSGPVQGISHPVV